MHKLDTFIQPSVRENGQESQYLTLNPPESPDEDVSFFPSWLYTLWKISEKSNESQQNDTRKDDEEIVLNYKLVYLHSKDQRVESIAVVQ